MIQKVNTTEAKFKPSDSKTFESMKNGAILSGVSGASLSLLAASGYKGNIKRHTDITPYTIDSFIKTNKAQEANVIDNNDIKTLNDLMKNLTNNTREVIEDTRLKLEKHQAKLFDKIEPFLPKKSGLLKTLKWTGLSAATGLLVVGIYEEVIGKPNK